jgi:hypothetical protein
MYEENGMQHARFTVGVSDQWNRPIFDIQVPQVQIIEEPETIEASDDAALQLKQEVGMPVHTRTGETETIVMPTLTVPYMDSAKFDERVDAEWGAEIFQGSSIPKILKTMGVLMIVVILNIVLTGIALFLLGG